MLEEQRCDSPLRCDADDDGDLREHENDVMGKLLRRTKSKPNIEEVNQT